LSQPQPVAGDPPRPPDAPPRRAVAALAAVADAARPVFVDRARSGPRRRLADVLVGIVIGLVVTAALLPAQGNSSFSKTAVYLAVVAVVGAFLGPLTAGVVSCVAIVGIWYVYLSPHNSFTQRSTDDALGIALTAVTAAVIVLVVARLESARRHARESERRLAGLLRIALALTSVRTRAELRDVLADEFRSVLGASSLAVVEPAGTRISWGLTVGYEGRVDAQWLALIEQGSPARAAMDTGRSVFLPTIDDLVERWPHLGDVVRVMGEPSRAAMPLPFEDHDRGAVTIGWATPFKFDAGDRDLLEALAAMLASAIARIRRSEQAAEAEYASALEAMLDAVAVYRAIRDPEGTVVDFELRFFNERSARMAGRDAPYVGRPLTDQYPAAAPSGLLAALVNVLEDGAPFVRDPLRFSTSDGVIRPVAVAASRQDEETVVVVVRDVSEREQAQRERELAIADAARRQAVVDELQRALLPQALPSLDAHTLHARYVAAEPDAPVGGDWYDAFLTPAGALVMAVGDVAGHGVAASGLMSLVRSAIRAYANESSSPAEILDRADRLVGTMEGFATCWLAAYSPRTGAYTWASAGHPPPVVVSRGGASFLCGDADPPLGLVTSARADHDGVLLPEQALVVYSDGLIERRGEALTEGLARLVEAAVDLDPGLHDLPDRLIASMPKHPGPRDDLCVLVLQRQ
jgi:PAS domain-containing protein